jgi:hypothetical protein
MTARLLAQFAQTIPRPNIPDTQLTSTRISGALSVFFMAAAAVALLVISIGAFQYVLSRGDAGAVKKAKETIIYAVVGLVIAISGYGIVTFVVTNL